ncbi:MAG: MBOAT family O-acyltransferase [Planctomycetota bacterium]
MVFTELRFFWFFAIVLTVYWLLVSNHRRKQWLLLCSYYFYGSWNPWFLSLLFLSTFIDFFAGLKLSQTDSPRARHFWIVTSMSANLGILAFFKYFNFFIESAVTFSSWMGIPFHAGTLSIILPVGISFYTFQSMSYTIDVYRDKRNVVHSFLDFALYVSFFPQLVAGPIVRASIFLPQLDSARRWSQVHVRDCLTLFLIGFFKKACVSDNLAPVVDYVFDDPTRCDWLSNWIGLLFYTTQIYCDFSGYTDMAIASSRLMGYELQMNFNFPYFATDVTEFWRRWHMSLSTWLRDYLYIPLGGNRRGPIMAYRNLLVTMLLGGLWHGAAWHFVLWGGIHGSALVAHREWTRRTPARFRESWGWNLVCFAGTFYFINLTWVVFRAEDLNRALSMLRAVCLFDSPGPRMVDARALLVMPPLIAAHYLARRRTLAGTWERFPDYAFAAIYGVLWAIALLFTPLNAKPFIYFQF